MGTATELRAISSIENQFSASADFDHDPTVSQIARTGALIDTQTESSPAKPESVASPQAIDSNLLDRSRLAENANRHLVEIFQRFGVMTMSFATLQPGMQYFESHGGYIAYDSSMGITFVLGDPVGPPELYAEMIDDFLAQHNNVVFCPISRPTAEIISRRGWYLNEFGADVELNLTDYDFDGPQKAKLRQAAHKIEREGYRIEELPANQIDQKSLEDLCYSWKSVKSIRCEARFLIRPIQFGPEPGVRKFYLFDAEERLCALIAFDPICLENQVLGYSPSIKRRAEWAPAGAEEAITKFAIEKFQAEGLTFMRMGFIPLYNIATSDFRDSWPLRKLLQTLNRYGDGWIFNFRGHADFKHRYRGEMTKVYLATQRNWGNVFRLLALMRLCRLL